MRIAFIASLSLAIGLTACTQPVKQATAAELAQPAAAAVAASGTDFKSALPASDPFGIPSPEAFTYIDPEPEESPVLPRAFNGAPPQINHETLSMLPIRKGRKNNECLSCHDKPDMIGKKPENGKYPMSKPHYTEAAGELKLDGAHYLCDQCHVPQADVKPLVENTFRKK